MNDLLDRLAEKTAEVQRLNRRLQRAHQQIDEGLALARRLHLGLLPQTFPDVPRARFAFRHRPGGPAGGAFGDVFRVAEGQAGFYVADVVGRGLAAGLLAVYVQLSMRAAAARGEPAPPGEVLRRLNRGLLELALSEDPFLTMTYALFDGRAGTLRFARAGPLCPVYVPRDGEPRRLRGEAGGLLGVFDAEFPTQTQSLRIGDKVLLGTGSALGPGEEGADPEGLAPAGQGGHRGPAVEDLVRQLSGAAGEGTLLGMEVFG